MAALKPSFHQNHLRLFPTFASFSPVKPFHLRKTTLTKATPLVLSFGSALLWSVHRSDGRLSITRCADPGSLVMSTAEASERPPFDLNLAVLLAGFAFEAYSSPPKDVGTREVDAADCQTVFLSESFVREIYDGQLFVKLKKGVDLPAMDPWGTSDPYVVMQLNGQVAKSNVKWATKEPIWNEDFILNIKITSPNFLQIAVWDANLVTPHKRMGNVGISLESLCDGKMHEVLVELEGMGGGGKIYLEVRYKSFDEIAKEKEWWKIPFISEFLMRSSLGSGLNAVIGSDGIQAREFVQAAFGQLRSFSFPQVQMGGPSNDDRFDMGGADMSLNTVQDSDLSQQDRSLESSERNLNSKNEYESQEFFTENNSFSADNGENSDISEDYFWKNFADNINQTIYKKLGFSLPEVTRWDGFDLLNNLALQSQRSAESEYIESGLVTPRNTNDDATINGTPPRTNGIESSISDIKMTSRNVLNQTEAILGALMVLAATLSKTTKDARTLIMNEDKNVASDMEVDDGIGYYSSEEEGGSPEAMAVDNKKTDEMRSLFLTAESAMEAWAMLATSLGRPSFIKSEFNKICFIDNVSTDTQVAIWRDSVQRRLVVAFRGTEQTSWKDLRTDLMLAPAGLNPERLGGDFKQEVQVHSGFLGAYDSVRIRIMTLVKTSIGLCEDNLETGPKWHVYVTGHSLGGALATLLALELSSSQMAKCGAIYVTMYNFGSPRVGNKKFAEVYNEKVKDSWRIVNHRDIIPTVPRLMGYCHVAQPVYLAAGDLKDSLANVELLEDGYQGDIIGEATPDVIVNEFMKGEREFIDKILQTEINIFLSIRDGSALMQHMEDFYYITLLEKVRSNYRVMNNSNANEADAFSA